MQEPRFVCGDLNYTIEHPSSWKISPIVGKLEETTLGGNQVKDISYRKYKYDLVWDAMSKEDYDKLEAIYNWHLDTNINVTFTYAKWSQASAGIDCIMALSPREFVAGSGDTFYYSKVTVSLIEEVKR